MLPPGYQETLRDIYGSIRNVDGWLTNREVSFLALLAAKPTAEGDILEIGSYRGRSTIVLARAKRLARYSQLIAIDPLPNEAPMARDESGELTARALFETNLGRAEVRSEVEFHQAYSYDLAESWHRPLRLLWIDGDHSYPSTKQDFQLYSPHLADGAVLAMHDVLSRYDGCIRVYLEEVLSSPHFGAAGLCGSIGWAQFWKDPERARSYANEKLRLCQRLVPLVPYHCQSDEPRGLAKLHYKVLRARVPHQRINPTRWAETVRFTPPSVEDVA